jgi:hypothetical protein
MLKIIQLRQLTINNAVPQLVEALRYELQGRGFEPMRKLQKKRTPFNTVTLNE